MPTWNSVHSKYLAFLESVVDFRLISHGRSVTVCLDRMAKTRMFVLTVSEALPAPASMPLM